MLSEPIQVTLQVIEVFDRLKLPYLELALKEAGIN